MAKDKIDLSLDKEKAFLEKFMKTLPELTKYDSVDNAFIEQRKKPGMLGWGALFDNRSAS